MTHYKLIKISPLSKKKKKCLYASKPSLNAIFSGRFSQTGFLLPPGKSVTLSCVFSYKSGF